MLQDGAFYIYLMASTIQSRAALAAATRLGSVARVTAVLLSLTASSSPAPPDGGLAAPPSKYGSHMGGRSIGSKKKIRHHVNPLKDTHQAKLQLEERWPERLFARPELPLHVDIGCARGLFCLDLASSSAEANVLGLEIRAALADAATEDAQRFGLRNAAFLACNANTNLDEILRLAAPCAPLRSVSIQFPDPWFKSKHHKRRVVQPDLVRAIARHLPPGGWLFFQSDVLDLSEGARHVIRSVEGTGLRDVRESDTDWLASKPDALLHVSTERERASEALGRPIYRACFLKEG